MICCAVVDESGICSENRAQLTDESHYIFAIHLPNQNDKKIRNAVERMFV